MFGIEILELIETILKCSKNDHFLIDDLYFRIISEKDAREKQIDISLYKSVDVHSLAIKYAYKFSELTNNKVLIESLSDGVFDNFLIELKKDNKLFGSFYSFLREDNVFIYEFCKNNSLPIILNFDIFENYFNKTTSFDNLMMNLKSLECNFKTSEVCVDGDMLDFGPMSELLEKLFATKNFKIFVFLYNILSNDSYVISNWLENFYDKVKIANFEIEKTKLLIPGKKNKIDYIFNVFSFDKLILSMVQSELKKYKQILNYEATDNPYGYAFSLDVFPNDKNKNPIETFFEFLQSNTDFIKRVKERTDKPLILKMIIRTHYYPQNSIEDVNVNPEYLAILSSLGIGIEIDNYFGD